MLERNIHHIIQEHLKGTISEPDSVFLNDWLKQSDENQMLYNELEKVWKLTGHLVTDVKVDTDTEWARFVQLRNKEAASLEKKSTLKINPLFILKIAAVLVPAILIGTWVYLHSFAGSTEWASVTTTNTVKNIQLPDGTKVCLNNYSTLSYPVKFSTNERLVKFTGEAFFSVSKTGVPFIIKSYKANVKVLGTKFNLRCYKTETISEISVQEGKVLFSSLKRPEVQALVEIGESASLIDGADAINKMHSTDANYLAWMNHQLSFNNTPMSKVGKALGRYFMKKVSLPAGIESCLFTGDFSQPKLTEMLDIICLSVDCKYVIKNDSLIFSGKGCTN